MTMRHFRNILLCVFTLFASQAWAGSPGKYQEQGLKLGHIVGDLLIEHSYCSTINDCNLKKLRFVGRTSTGIGMEVYQVSDPEVIQKIIAACTLAYAENGQSMDISLSMYRQPHEELMGFGKWHKKPFISLRMKGGQQ